MKANSLHHIRTVSISVLFLLIASFAQAQTTIIYDSFTTSNNVTLDLHTPDISLSGSNWSFTRQASSESYTPYVSTEGFAKTLFNGGGYISIASSGAYTKPTTFTISAILTLDTMTGSAGAAGLGLGFYSTTPSIGNDASIGFTGFTIHPSGQLRLIVNGASNTTITIADFSASIGYLLSYTIDTGTGKISSVTLNGNDYSKSFTGTVAFTDSVTNFAAFYGRSNNSTTVSGLVDDFRITTTETVIPEPATTALVIALLGFCLLFFQQSKRHRN